MQAVEGLSFWSWAEGWRSTLLLVPLSQPDSGAAAVLLDEPEKVLAALKSLENSSSFCQPTIADRR